MSVNPAVPHGYELNPDLHVTLRGDPPTETLDWVCRELGAEHVLGVRALPGGTSSAVHRIELGGHGGATVSVVVRRYVLDWLGEEPWTPGNEAEVLLLLADSPVQAPRLLAADLDGRVADSPTVVMSCLPGRVDWNPADLDPWLRGLAEALPAIHAVPVVPGLRRFAPYPPERPLPPAWSAQPGAWKKALACFHGPQPDVPQVFIHRDYHPGNVLWTGGRVSGVVDWPSACRGAAAADVGHCRANLVRRFGQEAADRFLAMWLTVSGTSDYDPYWDLTDVLSSAGGDDEPEPAVDAFVSAAAARR